MFLLPVGCLIFLLFILFLPILFLLGFFHIATIGFEKLGISSQMTIFLLLAILIGSGINIPLTKKKLVYKEKTHFFGLLKVPRFEVEGIAINLGGAIIPILLSFYFLYLGFKAGFELQPVLIATILMIIICKFLARVIPGIGIALPFFIPPIFSAIFALILAPGFTAPCAFVAGVSGTLIGADILNLRKAQKAGGFISIGGAGVFDGIFLVGIISALLAGI
ncbi:MAG: DUF1614 domain-containing protein [Patescibacteria group bacterium]|nr:DUF1614 domain-containing protein [Patescibacteria group bacterium]